MNYKKSRNRDTIPPTVISANDTGSGGMRLVFSEAVTSVYPQTSPVDNIDVWSVVDSIGRPYDFDFTAFTMLNILDLTVKNVAEQAYFTERNYYLRYNSTSGSWTDLKNPPFRNKLAEIDGTDVTITGYSSVTPPTLVYAGLGWNTSTFACGLQQTGPGTTTNSRSTISYSFTQDENGYVTGYIENAANATTWRRARWDGTTPYADDGNGVLLDPLPQVSMFPPATNYLKYSRDLSSSSNWTATNMTRTYDQVGLLGDSNTATLLTATAANAEIVSVTLAAGTTLGVGVVFLIKRVNGTGNIFASAVNSTTEQWQNLNVPSVTGVWHRVYISNAAIREGYVGIKIETNGDSIIVGNINFHDSTLVASMTGAMAQWWPPIFTTSATVTRNVDAITITSLPYNTGMSIFFEAEVWAGVSQAILMWGTTPTFYHVYTTSPASSVIKFYDSAATANIASSSDIQNALACTVFAKAGPTTTVHSIKVINSEGEQTWNSAPAYTGALGSSGTVKVFPPHAGSLFVRRQLIRRLRIWSTAAKTIQGDGYYI